MKKLLIAILSLGSIASFANGPCVATCEVAGKYGGFNLGQVHGDDASEVVTKCRNLVSKELDIDKDDLEYHDLGSSYDHEALERRGKKAYTLLGKIGEVIENGERKKLIGPISDMKKYCEAYSNSWVEL